MTFFFFKQKTAYEMRISDWSSDVCSSDLAVDEDDLLRGPDGQADGQVRRDGGLAGATLGRQHHDQAVQVPGVLGRPHGVGTPFGELEGALGRLPDPIGIGAEGQDVRSEEHTSELQSLMRISYAVFCLKNT